MHLWLLMPVVVQAAAVLQRLHQPRNLQQQQPSNRLHLAAAVSFATDDCRTPTSAAISMQRNTKKDWFATHHLHLSTTVAALPHPSPPCGRTQAINGRGFNTHHVSLPHFWWQDGQHRLKHRVQQCVGNKGEEVSEPAQQRGRANLQNACMATAGPQHSQYVHCGRSKTHPHAHRRAVSQSTCNADPHLQMTPLRMHCHRLSFP